jgi:hypothetical protein
MVNPWLSLFFETAKLGVEAQSVIALRLLRFAGGGAAAQTEVNRMITDKIAAGFEMHAAAASAIASGQKDTVVADSVLRVMKRRVHANKRRLSRG